jgi:hypothetical protein
MNSQWWADVAANMTANGMATFVMIAITWLLKKAALKWSTRSQPNPVKGAPAIAMKRTLPTVFNILWYLALLWFFFMQLKQLVDQAGPPSRMDTLLIAFWTWWALFVVSDMMGKYGNWLERRRSARA